MKYTVMVKEHQHRTFAHEADAQSCARKLKDSVIGVYIRLEGWK